MDPKSSKPEKCLTFVKLFHMCYIKQKNTGESRVITFINTAILCIIWQKPTRNRKYGNMLLFCLKAYLCCLHKFGMSIPMAVLSRRSAVCLLIGSHVRIPLRTWIFFSCDYWVLMLVAASATNWLPIQSSLSVCVCARALVCVREERCDLGTSKVRRPRPKLGCCVTEKYL
jgi:hypothetical protein